MDSSFSTIAAQIIFNRFHMHHPVVFQVFSDSPKGFAGSSGPDHFCEVSTKIDECDTFESAMKKITSCEKSRIRKQKYSISEIWMMCVVFRSMPEIYEDYKKMGFYRTNSGNFGEDFAKFFRLNFDKNIKKCFQKALESYIQNIASWNSFSDKPHFFPSDSDLVKLEKTMEEVTFEEFYSIFYSTK